MAVTKSGAGTWVLTGANTYTGPTIINAGTLQIGGTGSLGSGTYAGAITLSGGTLNYSSSTALQTLSGAITGAGALTMSGGGILALNNTTSSYTGPTTVSSGTLQLSSTIATNPFASPITVNSGAILQLNSAPSAGSGTSVTSAAATINLGGTLSYTSSSANNNYFVWTNAPVTAVATIHHQHRPHDP